MSIKEYLTRLWFNDNLDMPLDHWVITCNLNGYVVRPDWCNGMPVIEAMQ